MRKKLIHLILLLIINLFIVACQTVPITGRSQLLLLPEPEEIRMGLTAYEEILKKSKLSNDPQINALVQRVGWRIARATGRTDYKWEFKVIDDDKMINAFALPGGKVAVYTGILPVTKDEEGLATVMGHEVAHAIARHGGERVSQGLLLQLGAIGLNIAIQNKDPGTIQAINAAFGIGVNVGVVLPFSRAHESEADHMGLIYMAKAGYDPRTAIKFWQRMADAGKDRRVPPEFLSTHPSSATRIRQLELWMPEAMDYYLGKKK